MDSLIGCRICLHIGSDEEMYSIYNEDENNITIAHVIFLITGIQVDDDKDLPTKICKICLSEVLTAKQLREKCIENDGYIRQMYSQKSQPESVLEETDAIIEEISVVQEVSEPEISQLLPIKAEETEEVKSCEINNEVYAEFFEMEDLETLEAIEYIEEGKTNPADEHQFVITGEEPSKTETKPKKVQIRDRCSYCHKYFSNLRALGAHEASHFKEDGDLAARSFDCDLCGKEFAKKCYITTHMQNMHIVEKKYACNYCEKQYHNKWNYDNHTRTHLNQKPFQCEICSKTFFAQHKMKIHLRLHLGEKRYKCEYCDKAFNYYTDRKRHTMMAHTGERPYVCACGKGFVKRSSLQSHEKTHLKRMNAHWGED